MAQNGSILGSSPLGLLNLYSLPDTNNMSSFYGGNSRNLNVNTYNTKGASLKNRITSGYKSVRPYPDKAILDNQLTKNGEKFSSKYTMSNNLHNDSIYDLSILNIIDKLSGTKAALRPGDFAYLKGIGVHPNNRLMIARRFSSAINDNIFIKGTDTPIATLISWKPQDDDFLEITFNEEWIASDADFTNILNEVGEEFMIGGLGNVAEKAGGVIPIPGFTELLQRKVMKEIGVLEDRAGTGTTLPNANPNLIKESKTRKMVKYTEADSGLKCTVNVKMTCEYEMKFISGIDPTIVWMETIANILRFGTSESVTWGMSKNFSERVMKWVDNPIQLIIDVKNAFVTALNGLVENISDFINSFSNKSEDVKGKANSLSKSDKLIKNAAYDLQKFIDGTIGNLQQALTATISKYKFRILGVLKSLTGAPSTPWHITIGNPMRPVFTSGDMLTEGSVTLKLGPNLSFNNLPSSIIAEFTLINARPWGLQEILAKFNSGYLRVANVQNTFDEISSYYGNGYFKDDETGETNLKAKDVNNNSTNGDDKTTKEKIASDDITKKASENPTTNTATSTDNLKDSINVPQTSKAEGQTINKK